MTDLIERLDMARDAKLAEVSKYGWESPSPQWQRAFGYLAGIAHARAILSGSADESPAPQPPVEGLKELLSERVRNCPIRYAPFQDGSGVLAQQIDIAREDIEEAVLAALAPPSLTAEPSQAMTWDISAETKAQIEDIEANTRRAHLNAHNIIAGSPATLIEQSGKK